MRVLFIVISSLIAFLGWSQAQSPDSLVVVDSLSVAQELHQLREEFGQNKSFIDEVELVALKALSYYPELKTTRIVFKRAKIGTTLNARPTVGSLLFRGRTNRKYVIRLNVRESDSIIRFEQVPFAGKVGVLGHEFGHLVDYSERSFFGIIGRLLAYTSKKKKAEFEKEIDQLTITRGLRGELYTWAYFVLYQSSATAKYKAFKARTYLTPKEIVLYSY